jgi:hypothetical protein
MAERQASQTAEDSGVHVPEPSAVCGKRAMLAPAMADGRQSTWPSCVGIDTQARHGQNTHDRPGAISGKESTTRALHSSESPHETLSGPSSTGGSNRWDTANNDLAGMVEQHRVDDNLREQITAQQLDLAQLCPHHGPRLRLESTQTAQEAGNPNLVEQVEPEGPAEQGVILLDDEGNVVKSRENCICRVLITWTLMVDEEQEN